MRAIEFGVQDGKRRLHHRPEPGTFGGGRLAQVLGRHHDVARSGDFRHQDRVGSGLGDRRKVVLAPGCIGAIDPDRDLAVAVVALPHCGDDVVARDRLGVGRNRVFKIENQHVGRQALGLFQRPDIGTRHIKCASARPKDHQELPVWPTLVGRGGSRHPSTPER